MGSLEKWWSRTFHGGHTGVLVCYTGIGLQKEEEDEEVETPLTLRRDTVSNSVYNGDWQPKWMPLIDNWTLLNRWYPLPPPHKNTTKTSNRIQTPIKPISILDFANSIFRCYNRCIKRVNNKASQNFPTF